MAKLRVGIDIDGVLADFNTPYIKLIKKYTGIQLPDVSEYYPNTWHYERAAGVDKNRENAMWKEIKSTPGFWETLPVLEGAPEFIDRLKGIDMAVDALEVYFITNRAGLNVKEQTEKWLRDRLAVANPTVLICQEKGIACRALKLTHYIDDKNENCVDALRDAKWTERDGYGFTQIYMLKRPWNSQQLGVPRIQSLDEFASILVAEHI